MKDLLIIFTRNPELGQCKTRLAATIGDDAALKIYKLLLHHTVSVTKDLPVDKQVFYSERISNNDIWNEKYFSKQRQEGKDLGIRMEHAFLSAFAEGYQRVIIIGSDLYDLQTSDLQEAFAALEDHDYVIGPAMDGGYYLLGMKSINRALFVNKSWGTATVFKETMKQLKEEDVYILTVKNDIDRYEDIKDLSVFKPFIKQLK